MDLFSISDLSRYSGILPHTIRIWESRYGALTPERSEGNTRYYDGHQLRRLLNIVSLSKMDYRVSELSAMSDQKLFGLIASQMDTKKEDGYVGYCIDQLIASSMTYDEIFFDKIFSHCLIRYGIKNTYTRVVYPMLEKIGLLWNADTIPPAREHFLSNLLRQKLFSAIDSLPPPGSGATTWVLFLPEDEFHELGLLFAHYLLKSSGYKSIYLGTNVPLQSIRSAVTDLNPDRLLFFMVHYDLQDKPQEYLGQLKLFFKKEIYIAGHPGLLEGLKPGGKVTWLKSSGELEEALNL